MTIRKKIINLLQKETLDSLQISERLPESLHMTVLKIDNHLWHLMKKRRVIRFGEKPPYRYRSFDHVELMRFLYKFIHNRTKCTISDDVTQYEKAMFAIIRMIIK